VNAFPEMTLAGEAWMLVTTLRARDYVNIPSSIEKS
jgi:hypothetical protein